MTAATPPQDETGFGDVFVREEGEVLAVSYRSGLAVCTEVFRAGALSSAGWNGAGFVSPTDVLPNSAGRPGGGAFLLEAGGEELVSGWSLQGVDVEPAGGRTVGRLRLRHDRRGLNLTVVTAADGTGVLARHLEITNTGNAACPVGRVAPWSGTLWSAPLGVLGAPATETAGIKVGTMQDARWGHEGDFGWETLGDHGLVVSGRRQRPAHRHPLFAVSVDATGETFLGQLGWSGGYRFEFDYERYPEPRDKDPLPRLTFAMAMDAPAPQVVLAPGESIRTPVAHLGLIIGDLDRAVHAMVGHVRGSLLARPSERVGLVEAGIGPEQEMTEESILREIERAAEIGAEVFIIDANWYSAPGANWFTTVGDWAVGSRFPRGLAPMRDRAHELGMKFGLWMEPERLGVESAAFAAGSELLAQGYEGQPPRGLLDLARPEAARWVEDAITRMVEENGVDLFRLDFNVGYLGDGFVNFRDGYAENHYWRYYDALYGIFARLRHRFPEVLFENCAAGGARTDLGMVAGFDTTWVTDWQLAPRSFSITNGMTLALPPELVDRHIGMGMNDHLAGSLDFQLRLTLFGHPTIAWTTLAGSRSNPQQVGRIRHLVELYRSVVRPHQRDSLVHHHTPDRAQQQRDGWGVLERAARDRSVSVLGAFRLVAGVGPEELRVRPRGIDPGRRYRVHYDNEDAMDEQRGSDLVRDGLPVRCRGALTSQLFVLEALD